MPDVSARWPGLVLLLISVKIPGLRSILKILRTQVAHQAVQHQHQHQLLTQRRRSNYARLFRRRSTTTTISSQQNQQSQQTNNNNNNQRAVPASPGRLHNTNS